MRRERRPTQPWAARMQDYNDESTWFRSSKKEEDTKESLAKMLVLLLAIFLAIFLTFAILAGSGDDRTERMPASEPTRTSLRLGEVSP